MSQHSYKSSLSNYKGTILPSVHNIINKCVGMERKYRIVTEESLKEIDNQVQDNLTMTIVIEPVSGKLVRNFWGNETKHA
jgi:hypothetical protein